MKHTFGSCYIELTDDGLTVGNALFERRWRVENGLLYPVSFCAFGTEWIARPAEGPAPLPEGAVPDEPRVVTLVRCGEERPPVEAPSLVAEVVAEGATLTLRYRFQVFPAAAGAAVQLAAEESGTAPAPQGAEPLSDSSAEVPTGVEEADSRRLAPPAREGEVLDCFELSPPHLRLVQVVLRDQTDRYDELVFENEWLLHSNEQDVLLQGNLFFVENTLTGAGLVFLKQAPLPHARPHKCAVDFRASGSGLSFGRKPDEAFGPGHPRYPLAHRCAFFGHGTGGERGEGYPYVVLAYEGGRSGRVEALQTYQRQLRRYDPQRDGMFLSNTWGDRSQDSRINESFLQEEVAAAARLGVDVVQIDDGWQTGRTSNWTDAKGGVWEGYWAADPRFWEPNPERLPNGLAPLVAQARESGRRFGLWFSPDSVDDFANWQKDAAKLLELHHTLGIDYFKMDGIKARTRAGERSLHRLFDTVLRESGGVVTFDLDVTAEIRPGYFGMMHTGPLFVENRYTDFHRYWPHQTLRNLWKLAQYLDPLRLRMEFLNQARNADLYVDDPLAPSAYSPAYLFATVMFANPLGWFEVSNLPKSYFEEVAPLVRVWREHREAIFSGTIIPIGDPPDGTAWTGFVSAAADRRSGYLLLFREHNDRARWETELPWLDAGKYSVRPLAGSGVASVRHGRLEAKLPTPQTFLFAEVVPPGRREEAT
ncbi:MAG: hypothetical protein AUJ96_07840 [Armatimonadetes bacterium CG2_30_66_41]|nr:hypothetical protein [Armatimonadota bacterium]OIP07264.1 MAG: hypothetical protein AUJ96_07840 [Armatimonadetes bacterium CG2_30_66_41]